MPRGEFLMNRRKRTPLKREGMVQIHAGAERKKKSLKGGEKGKNGRKEKW